MGSRPGVAIFVRDAMNSGYPIRTGECQRRGSAGASRGRSNDRASARATAARRRRVRASTQTRPHPREDTSAFAVQHAAAAYTRRPFHNFRRTRHVARVGGRWLRFPLWLRCSSLLRLCSRWSHSEGAVLVERQAPSDGVDFLGRKRLEGQAGERCLSVELGESGVAHERHGKALLSALLSNI